MKAKLLALFWILFFLFFSKVYELQLNFLFHWFLLLVLCTSPSLFSSDDGLAQMVGEFPLQISLVLLQIDGILLLWFLCRALMSLSLGVILFNKITWFAFSLDTTSSRKLYPLRTTLPWAHTLGTWHAFWMMQSISWLLTVCSIVLLLYLPLEQRLKN